MLEQVKQHAEYCGGHSAFTLIQKDGKVRTATRIYPSVNAELVSYFEEFDEAVALLLAAGPNLEITSEKYDERLSAFSERMRNLRRQFRSLNTLNKITLKDLNDGVGVQRYSVLKVSEGARKWFLEDQRIA